MAATQHHRAPTHPKRPTPLHSRSKSAVFTKRSAAAAKQPRASPKKEDDDDDLMAASFLNFCTVCEKQIIVPNNSILYCSESCRKKDNTKELSFEPSPPPTPYASFFFDDTSPSRDIVPPRSPTVAPAKRLSYGFSDASEDESDWHDIEKPRPQETEATRYLRSFPRSSTELDLRRPVRPTHNRANTAMVLPTTHSAAPSLSHTPTSTLSVSMPYTPSSRPLLPRRHPHSTSSRNGSIDLVNPFVTAPPTAPSSLSQCSLKCLPSCTTSTGVAEGELELFQKRTPTATSPGQGSLKALFAFSAMQAPPTSSASTMRPFVS
ncbi:life-span regulatory factor-domain-containing protein [Phyllosticta citribraziliensis]|uniref:Life-span regulatory factor-domain-containing protein n=1 Tax=Phyllosticta citribraziliensis TaxID=989973 RepID=A0ABR1LTQ7_9PEZI